VLEATRGQTLPPMLLKVPQLAPAPAGAVYVQIVVAHINGDLGATVDATGVIANQVLMNDGATAKVRACHIRCDCPTSCAYCVNRIGS
jgi:hypothetical protein